MSSKFKNVGYRYDSRDTVKERINRNGNPLIISDKLKVMPSQIIELVAPELILEKVTKSGHWYCKVCDKRAKNMVAASMCCS